MTLIPLALLVAAIILFLVFYLVNKARNKNNVGGPR